MSRPAFVLILLTAILSSCAPVSLPQTPGAKVTNLLPEVTKYPAITVIPSPSFTLTDKEEGKRFSLIEATTSPPSSLSYTQTSVALSTASWMPALSEAEAEEVAIDLLRDNGDCRLPCFWGFVPGQVSQETLDSFFHAFYNIGGPTIMIPSDNSAIKISVTWNYSDNPRAAVRWLWAVMTSERVIKLADGKYNQSVFDDLNFPQYIQYYTLPNLLSTYGMPSKAYIGIDPGEEMGFDNIFHLYLDYSVLGWGAQFRMPLKQDNHSYLGCPARAFTSLSLWSPDDTAAATENQAWVAEFGIFKPFEEVTSLSLDEFYNQFKDSNNAQCFETPVDIWLVSK